MPRVFDGHAVDPVRSPALEVSPTFAGNLAHSIRCIHGPRPTAPRRAAFIAGVTAIAQTAAVPAVSPQRAERARFCSRCAFTANEPDAQSYGFGRVCERCGMGVMLTAPREALPPSAAAFLVVNREGKISAVSEHA